MIYLVINSKWKYTDNRVLRSLGRWVDDSYAITLEFWNREFSSLVNRNDGIIPSWSRFLLLFFVIKHIFKSPLSHWVLNVTQSGRMIVSAWSWTLIKIFHYWIKFYIISRYPHCWTFRRARELFLKIIFVRSWDIMDYCMFLYIKFLSISEWCTPLI